MNHRPSVSGLLDGPFPTPFGGRPMRRVTFLVLLTGLLLSHSLMRARADDKDSWVGKKVMPKKAGIRIGKTHDMDEKFDLATLTTMIYSVEAEQGKWIKVRQNGVEGWFAKEDAILLEDAVDYFTQRIRANPKDDFGYAMRGLARHEKGEIDIALKDYDEAIRLAPKLSDYWNNRGVAWGAKGEYDKALKDYDEAIRLDPKFALAFSNRGFAWSQKKDYDKALKDYDQAIQLEPKCVDAFYNRGNAWIYKRDCDKAIRDYDEAIRLDPRCVDAFGNRGTAWYAKKEYDKAIKDYDEVIRLDPKHARAFYNKACCCSLQGKADLAFDSLQRSLELGYRDFEDMAKDSDLDSIRSDPRYKKLLDKYAK
jgi:tetratricopeptide (TPR) repeat protein